MTPPRLKLRITKSAENLIRGGHPWLFAGSVLSESRKGEMGELAVIYDQKDRFLAIGLYDPDSPIRLRVLSAGKPVTIDDAWWRNLLTQTAGRRSVLFGSDTTGYRLIHGENDGWPGLVLDRYGDVMVLKIYSAAWFCRLKEITRLIEELILPRPTVLVLRLSRNIQDTASRDFDLRDASLLSGNLSGMTHFLENGLRFEADVLRGQKTGFFLDQRENRKRIGELTDGAEVLNAFSFSGGFSVYAARGGAVSVTDLDISQHALDAGKRNFDLNQEIETIGSCRRDAVAYDAFLWLEKNQKQFDIVILDPPSLAKREMERQGALQAYAKLVRNGIKATRKNGILFAASCSAHVSEEEFFETVKSTASASRRDFEVMQTAGHAPDHPATFSEGVYLKAIYLKLKT